MGVKIKATGELKLNDSPVTGIFVRNIFTSDVMLTSLPIFTI